MKSGFEQYYDEAVEPGRRERAYAWATAIGLQDVDGLKPSRNLYETARRHIEGEITQEEARRIVDEYYETKDGHDLPSDTQEEKVLNGASVEYAPSFLIERTLEYDFERERKFDYRSLSEDAFVAHFAAFISEIWQIHPFREGNTRTTAMFAIKYLRSKGFPVSNDLFARESWYFRNALVRANYENAREDVVKTTLFLEDFFKVLLYGCDLELKNRFLRIGFEHGSPKAMAVSKLHRRNGKLDIDGDKLDIGSEKLDIRALPQPTQSNIKKLAETLGKREFFKRADALQVLSLTPTAVSNLFARMNKLGLIGPIKGHGKGAWRFRGERVEDRG